MTIREMMAMYHSLKFVEELIDYIEEYPDDDYMTMECLCRKLVKYHLMSKVDGYYTADRKTEPQYDIDKGTIKCDNCSENGSYKCSKCDGEIYFKRLEVDDEPQIDGAIDEARFKAHCMNCQRDVADIKCLDCDGDKYFIADEPQTDCSWK